MFNPRTNGHNGAGWIASLEAIVRKQPEIELGVAFYFEDSRSKIVQGGVTYYPISSQKSSLWQRLTGNNDDAKKVEAYLQIVRDFRPDLIHIFGSENDFGLICKQVKVPVVIHIQGCLPPYHNALFPIGMNTTDFWLTQGLDAHSRFMGLRSEPSFRKRAEKEIQVIKSCPYFMGRTDWDKNLISLFHPEAVYYHCEEALRSSFLQIAKPWTFKNRPQVKVISVISRPWYKGADLILKTAKVLKEFTPLDFEWNVYGVGDLSFYEHKYGIKAKDVNVKVRGTASQETLVAELSEATCYVHSSYIDNSPNSLCEAQIIGVPVLATHVGGIPTLVEGGAGVLFPTNDPYTLAGLIRRSASDRVWAETMSAKEREAAGKRHNPDAIRECLWSIYQQIVADHGKHHPATV